MEKRKVYAFICLASLLLFFQSSVFFIADVLLNYHVEEVNTCVDFGERENTNRSSNPLEEETLHSSISIVHSECLTFQKSVENRLYSFKMKTSWQENTTPPPERV
ncbi:hypothetical protein CW751_02665 [Brumimicrobium salinarum]|uniref:Uncharacterized protein n=1 Tax=Brumimicrobium salinarum TaxID=2058658 RepID=A0A2I0R6P2_9FLAO|nr:hypothetical protein [Brumimicrobium salinarum]PKR82251.1 hypothetical protein CW751_02665 [Brumimicrobium salinarum]